MLQQIMPDKIGLYWSHMKSRVDEIIKGVPGESIHKLNNILHDLLSGKKVGWISYHNDNGRKKSDAFIITEVISDPVTETKSLLLFCMVGDNLPESSWIEGFEAIEKYGVSRGCTRMTAYTDSEAIIQRVRDYGGGFKEYSFLSVPFIKENS